MDGEGGLGGVSRWFYRPLVDESVRGRNVVERKIVMKCEKGESEAGEFRETCIQTERRTDAKVGAETPIKANGRHNNLEASQWVSRKVLYESESSG